MRLHKATWQNSHNFNQNRKKGLKVRMSVNACHVEMSEQKMRDFLTHLIHSYLTRKPACWVKNNTLNNKTT